MMRTMILFGCSFVGTFLALLARRKYLEFKDIIANMDNDINTATNTAHHTLNMAADNRTNIIAHHAEWKELHARNVEQYSVYLNQAKRECAAHIKALEDKLIERDHAIAQQFSDVYEYIERCNNEEAFVNDIIANLESPVAALKKPKPKQDK